MVVRCRIKRYESESLNTFIEIDLKIKLNLAELYLIIDMKLEYFFLAVVLQFEVVLTYLYIACHAWHTCHSIFLPTRSCNLAIRNSQTGPSNDPGTLI